MSLSPGTRLGPYEVTAQIGAGGMGEVYKARDTRLDRTVAIKVLGAELANDTQFRDRFDREARTISQLDHPHICALYDVGEHDGTSFLVMQYLEGETVESRLKNGALPLDQALQYAIQIADALDKAHRAGIVHRDLKPGNLMLTKTGAKLLDFGLAKASSPAIGRTGLSMLPTTPPGLTAQGTILGTFQYMAPEQLEGLEADARSDIFAFGAVLYEMLAGRKAFEGRGHASLIGAIMHAEPAPVSSVQPLVPRSLDRIVRKCLAKDPDERWQSARDLLDELKWIGEAGDHPVAATAAAAAVSAPGANSVRHALWRRALLFSVALLTTAAIAASLTWLLMRGSPPQVSRLIVTASGNAALTLDGTVRDLTITPDGARIIYVGANGTSLFVRALDALEPVAIVKGAPRTPFVSPDGQWVGFADANNYLRKVAISGGPAVTITRLDSAPRGATWLTDNTIVFATSGGPTGLQRVSADGGSPTVVTRPDRERGELDHLWPEALPVGRGVLFTITSRTGGLDAAQVALLDLETGTSKVLVGGASHAHYAASGHLVYGAAGTLRTVAFDVGRVEARGTPVLAVSDVATTAQGALEAVVATNGTLAYVSGGETAVQRTLVWVDRQGRETPIPLAARAMTYPRITPDGSRVALYMADRENDLWLWDVVRETLTRLTFEPGLDIYPIWTPDSRRLIFSSERAGGARNIFWQPADGSATAERLSESPNLQDSTAVTPDGSRLLFNETNPATSVDLMQLELPDTRELIGASRERPVSARRVTPLIQTPFIERNGVISTDGRWLAYEANESGQFEIYVRPYPEVTSGLWQVSTGGGTRPMWAHTGRELFYVAPTGALMRVAVERSSSWAAGTPTKLLNEGYFVPGGNPGRTYDVSSDDQRFLMIRSGSGTTQGLQPQIVVVQNWFEELKRLVPAN